MSNFENILARWSRLKKDAQLERFQAKWAPVRVKKTRQNKKIERYSESTQTESALVRHGPVSPPCCAPEPAVGVVQQDPSSTSVGLATLPPIESIDAETDLRGFLDKDVAASLTRAALRRGWSTDPAIRDFVGLSENSWDFNSPGPILGFGSLAPEDVQNILTQTIGATETTDDVSWKSGADPTADQATTSLNVYSELSPQRVLDDSNLPPDENAPVPLDEANEAKGVIVNSSPNSGQFQPTQPRRHGGALPRIN